MDRELVGEYIQFPKIAKDFANYLELYYKYRDDYQVEQVLAGHISEAAVDKLQRASRPMYGPYVRRVTESRRPPALSPAALEVLTIIAYRQPVTRAFIDQLRGVDSSNTVSSLAEKGLIEEAGRLDVPGKPMLFRTTDQFLRSFSLASIEDLPALPALEENEQMELNMDGTLHETPPGEQLRFLNGEPVPPETE